MPIQPVSKALYRIVRDGQNKPVCIYLVNGDEVKRLCSMDFTEGDHDLHNPTMIPKGEIWIDARMTEPEWEPIIMHELKERELMRGGMAYEQAHAQANTTEKKLRESRA